MKEILPTIRFLIALSFIVLQIKHATAQVVISGPLTFNGFCGGNDAYITIPNIIIGESSVHDINTTLSGNTIIFSILSTSGFEFRPGFGSIVMKTPADYSAPIISVSKYQFTITYNPLGTINQLDVFTITGLQARSSFGGGIAQIERTDGSASIVGLPLGQVIRTLTSKVASGGFTGLKEIYCQNESSDDIIFTPANGTFFTSPILSGLITTTPGGRSFNPSAYTNTTSAQNFTITFTYPDANGSGCTVDQKTILIQNRPTGFQIISPSVTGFAKFQNTQVPLTGTLPANCVGVFSGFGVSGNTFYVDLVPDFDDYKVTYTVTNTVTGCSDTTSRVISVFDPSLTLVFTPTSPAGSGKFCASDATSYAMQLQPSLNTPEEQYNLTYPLFCDRSASIVNGYENVVSTGPNFGPGITGTFGGINTFRLTPNLAQEGISSLIYTADYLQIQDGDCSGGARIPPYQWSVQVITIIGTPSKPVLSANAYEFCLSAIPNLDITFTSTITGTTPGANFNWYRYIGGSRFLITSTGVNTISLAQLGITNSSTVGGYTFGVTNQLFSCEGDTSSLFIRIKRNPKAPNIRISNFTKAYCVDNVLDPKLVSDSSHNIPKPQILWFTESAGNYTLISNADTLIPALQNNVSETFTFYAAQVVENCSSISIVTMLGSTLSQQQIVLHRLPTITGIVNGGVHENYCQGQTLQMVTVASQDLIVSPSNVLSISGFRWYFDAEGINPLPDSVGISSLNGSTRLNRVPIHTIFNTTQVLDTSIYLRTRSTVGCLSAEALKVPIRVKSKPNPPLFVNVENGYLGGEPQCINTLNNTSLIGLNSNATYNWYSDEFLTTLLGTGSPYNTGISVSTPIDVTFHGTQILNGCESDGIPVRIHILPGVPVPNGDSPAAICTGQTLPILNATTTSFGAFIRWYTNYTLTSSIFTGESLNLNNTPFISNTLAGVTLFYATQVLGNCESSPHFHVLTVIVKQTPEPPIVKDTAYCFGQNISPLRAQSTNSLNPTFRWFRKLTTFENDTSNFIGTGITTTLGLNVYNYLPINTLIGHALPGRKSFYVKQVSQGCHSEVDSLNYIIFTIPNAPNSSSPVPICNGDALPLLNSNGLNIRWYNSTLLSPINQVGLGTRLNVSTISGVNNTEPWTFFGAPPKKYFFYSTQTTNILTIGGAAFSGCESASAKDSIVVYPQPPTPSTTSPSPYCSGQTIFALTAVGVAGPNASQITWYNNAALNSANLLGRGDILQPNVPSVVQFSADSIFYVTQTINNCRSAASSITIRVNPLPIVNFTGLGVAYCVYEQPVNLFANFNSGTFFSTGKGLTDNGNGTALFSPTVAHDSIAPYIITYTYTDGNNCTNSISKSVKINPSPIVTFTGLSPEYCMVEGLRVRLNASSNLPGIGTYSRIPSGPGITGNEFIPIFAGEGSYQIKLKWIVDGTGCNDSVITPVIVHTQPVAQFDLSTRCVGDLIQFIDNSTLSGSSVIQSWKWNVGPTVLSTTQGASFTFSEPRNYTLSLRVESNVGCLDSITRQFFIGPYPLANFTWRNICFGDTVKYTSTSSVSQGQLTQYLWTLGELNITQSGNNLNQTQFTYANTGPKIVSLKVVSSSGCADDTTIVINILPTIHNYPAKFDFNTSAEGWFAEGNTSWQYGETSKTKLKIDGKHWVTNLDNPYRANENGWVNSPCFDFSSLSKPFVSLDIKRDMAENHGGVLQASLNGITWHNIGKFEGTTSTGIYWYNATNITGNPGNQSSFLNGWTGSSGGLPENARHTLQRDEANNILINNSKVRFRVAFASLSDSLNNLDGFSFDNFEIRERSKKAVIEYFTNATSPDAYQVLVVEPNDPRLSVRELVNANQKDVVGIAYHTSFPNPDAINSLNPEDPSSRILYYGINRVPTLILSGNAYSGYPLPRINDEDIFPKQGVNQYMIDRDVLQDPAFDISITNTLSSENLLTVDISLKANIDMPTQEYVLQVGVLERRLRYPNAPFNDTIQENVLRKLLPDAAGSLFNQSFTPGTQVSKQVKWQLPSYVNTNELATFAYIQNKSTKQIYQAAYNGPTVPYSPRVIDNDIVLNQDQVKQMLKVYPNPFNEYITIGTESNANPTFVELVDTHGNVIISQFKPSGVCTLKTEHLTHGVYILKVFQDKLYYAIKMIK